MPRGIRISARCLLLIAVLGILSHYQRRRAHVRFAERNNVVLNEALRIELWRYTSDSALWLRYADLRPG